MEWINSIVEFFRAGGPFMFTILLILAIGTAIILERMLFFTRVKTNAENLWTRIQTAIREGKLEEAILQCEGSRAALPRMLLPGLQRARTMHQTTPALSIQETREELENAIEESILEIMPQMEKRTHYLPVLANAATLLGLLGTVMGLIHSFKAVSVADPAQKAALLAYGISEAMNNTAFGLIVAVPMMLVYAFLHARTIKMVDHIDAYSVKLINLLTSTR